MHFNLSGSLGLRWADRCSLLALCALCLLPFLEFRHVNPISSFYNEALAFACGLLILPGLAGRALPLPRIALAPLLLLAAITLQYVWLPAGLRVMAWLAMLYLVWLLLVMLATATLRQQVAPSVLAARLAVCLVAAAVVNALCLILFHAGLRAGAGWFFLRADAYGNLAQVNHVADLLWLGIASLLYLWQRNDRYRLLWVALLPVLLLGSALTGGRAPFLYMAALVVLAWLGRDRRVLLATLWVGAAYLLVLWGQHVFLSERAIGAGSIARIAESAHYGAGGSVRLGLMAMAASIVADHPWLGVGWGGFDWASYQRVVPGLPWQGTAEHAHQLFFQIAVELGVLPALLLALLLLAWVRRVLPLCDRPETRWAVAVAGIVLLHAQVEYPLWYAHFAGVCAVALVLAEPRMPAAGAWQLRAVPVALLMGVGFSLLTMTWADHNRMAAWLRLNHGQDGRPVASGHFTLLAELQQGSLLESEAALALAAMMAPDAQMVEAKRTICARALLIQPQTPTVFGCALLDYRAGDTALAEQRWSQALLVFRADAPAYLHNLREIFTLEQLRPVQPLLDQADRVLAQPAP